MAKIAQVSSSASRIPTVAAQFMAEQGIVYRKRNASLPLPARQKVFGALFEDDCRAVLALFPAHKMLDPVRCCRGFNELLPVEGESFRFGHALGHVYPSEALLSLPCIYDPELFEPASLLLSSDDSSACWEVSSHDFRRLLQPGRGLPIASRLDAASSQPSSIDSSFLTRRIEQRIQRIGDLPLLPQTLQKLLKMQTTANVNVQELIDLIETDPPLSAQVISWACLSNGTGYVESVEEAVTQVLDVPLTQELIYAMLSGHTWFPARAYWQPALEYGRMALRMAAVVDSLLHMVRTYGQVSAGLGYLAGLLHNIGDWLLIQRFADRHSLIHGHQDANPHMSAESIERFFLGMTLAELSASLLHRWSLPQALQIAVRHQDDPDYTGDYAVYANLLYLASGLLQNHITGGSEVRQDVFERWNIPRDQAEAAVCQIIEFEHALRPCSR